MIAIGVRTIARVFQESVNIETEPVDLFAA